MGTDERESMMTNRELAAAFFEEFFNHHDFSAIDRYLSPHYIQHDWDVPPGREGFRRHFEAVFAACPDFRVDIKHILEDGDMVAVHGYGVSVPGRVEVLVADLYRVEDGKLAEHWGTVQPLPPELFGNPQLM